MGSAKNKDGKWEMLHFLFHGEIFEVMGVMGVMSMVFWFWVGCGIWDLGFGIAWRGCGMVWNGMV